MKEKRDNLIVKLPFGFRDIFPTEAAERNKIEETVREVFKLWGYGEVKTPVVEYTENIAEGVGAGWENKLINFFDVDGSLASLRADMTVPIARLTGMRIKKSQLPVRFCYFANCFRQSAMQKGVKRAYSQAGLEFIGSQSFMSDVEVIVILTCILEKLGIGEYKIGMGHIKVLEGLFGWLGLGKNGKEYITRKLIFKNLVAIDEFLKNKHKSKKDIFLNLLKPEQKIEDVRKLLEKVDEKRTTEGFDYLKSVYESLEKMGLGNYLIIDLSILRDFEYYTGLLFEVYPIGLTEILGSGGRYDGLISKFGLDVPATGFALDIDLVHKSMKESKLSRFDYKKKILLYGEDKNCAKLIKLSEDIRKEGFIVELIFDKEIDFRRIAVEKEYNFVGEVDLEFRNIIVTDLEKDKKKAKTIDNFLKEIKDEK